MSKSDWDFVNKSQDDELNKLLKKHRYRQTKANRELLRDRLPQHTRHEEVNGKIVKIVGLEKRA